MKRQIIIFPTIISAFLITGCFLGDRISSITITNTTVDTLYVQLRQNFNFHSEKEKFSTTADGLNIYKLAPREAFGIGTVINELGDKIPFSQIKVISKGDTLINNQGDALILFDKTTFGDLEIPYNISIRKH